MSSHVQNKLKGGEKLRVFVTGATGYIGQEFCKQAVSRGWEAYGLSRTDDGDAKLKAIGAVPVRGDFGTPEVFTKTSTACDAVVHLAYIHNPATPPGEIAAANDVVVEAICSAIKGTDKPLLIASGLAGLVPDPEGKETDETAPLRASRASARMATEQRVVADEDIHAMAVRFAPYVYGHGGKGFLLWLISEAMKLGESLYINDGGFRTTTLHVDDAATFLVAAIEHGKAHEIYNATSQTNVTLKQMAEAIGEVVGVPVRSATMEEVSGKWGPGLSGFNYLEIRGANAKAKRDLAWEPVHLDFLEDITSGSYSAKVKEMKARASS